MSKENQQPDVMSEHLTLEQKRFYQERLSFSQEAQSFISDVSLRLLGDYTYRTFRENKESQREVEDQLRQYGLNDQQVADVFQFFNIPHREEDTNSYGN